MKLRSPTIFQLSTLLFLFALNSPASQGLPEIIQIQNIKLKQIPIGEKVLGLPDQSLEMEEYQGLRKVKITKPFYIGTTEITQDTWQKIMGKNPSFLKNPKHPVENITWLEAQSFCKLLNRQKDPARLPEGMIFRLPSESEWEFAARADSSDLFFFGNQESSITTFAWIYLNSKNQSHPVASLQPNPYGLYDIYGNVREWCQDGYEVAKWNLKNPLIAPAKEEKVHRGGSWDSCEECCKSGTRSSALQNAKSKDLGFRVAFGFPL